MRELSSPTPEVTQQLTGQHAAEIIFGIFDHAQGDASFQPAFLWWLGNARPDFTLDRQTCDETRTYAIEMFSRYLYPNRNNPEEPARYHVPVLKPEMLAQIDHSIESMATILNSPEKFSGTRALAVRIDNRDYHYIVKEGGRQYGNPNFSYFQHYAIDGNSTGILEFDQMYREIGEMYKEHPEIALHREEIQRVIAERTISHVA